MSYPLLLHKEMQKYYLSSVESDSGRQKKKQGLQVSEYVDSAVVFLLRNIKYLKPTDYRGIISNDVSEPHKVATRIEDYR